MIVKVNISRATKKTWGDYETDKAVYFSAIKKFGSGKFEAVLMFYPCSLFGNMALKTPTDNYEKDEFNKYKMEGGEFQKTSKVFATLDEAENWLYSQILLEGLL